MKNQLEKQKKLEVNEHQIYIKFICAPDMKEKKGTGV